MNHFEAGFEAGIKWQKLKQAKKADRSQVIKDYCQCLIKFKEQGILSIEEVGYRICSLNSIISTWDVVLDEILEIACDLELPAHHRCGAITQNESETWKRLVKLTKQISAHNPQKPTLKLISLEAKKYHPDGSLVEAVLGWVIPLEKGYKIQIGDPQLQTSLNLFLKTHPQISDQSSIYKHLQKKKIGPYTITARIEKCESNTIDILN